ncbi:MAG: putative motility protein [Methylococcales bacterium]
MVNSINTTQSTIMAAVAAHKTQQDIAVSMVKKGLEVDKMQGEALLKLIDSAAATAHAGRIDLLV